MNMIAIKLLGIVVLNCFLLSCQNEQHEEVINLEIFLKNDLSDFSEADESFVGKYSKYIKNTTELYDIENYKNIVDNSSFKSESGEFNKSIEYKLYILSDTAKYYILNNLYEFNDFDDVGFAWRLGESLFWTGFMKHSPREDFKFYRDDQEYRLGELSEYSELVLGDFLMVFLHIKWNKLIIHYNQVITPRLKQRWIKRIENNFNKIKEIYDM